MTESGGDRENPELAAMHRDLIALMRRLELSMDSARDAAAIGVISDQILEATARVTAVGRVLLAAQTEEISRHARAVSAAIPEVERRIEDIEHLERMVSGMTAVLDAADNAVRVASLVCS